MQLKDRIQVIKAKAKLQRRLAANTTRHDPQPTEPDYEVTVRPTTTWEAQVS